MGAIHLLSDLLASQVAAGEVVERPASVLKELVENSIDAGATRIEVSFEEGGMRRLCVTDNGCGMDRSDALLCLERHATSKIKTLEDLIKVETLGFRGEAIPSIASVSRFSMTTHPSSTSHQEAVAGTAIVIEGGKITKVADSGCAVGTRIEVRDLFFNVPARKKFLKTEQTETAHLLQQLQVLAIAHPKIAFTCFREDREFFRLAATDSLAVRLRDLYGTSFLERMQEVPRKESEGVTLFGFFARPGEGRADRSHQFLFVNGRMVRSPFLSQVLRKACDGILAKGLQPPAVLFIEADPATIDCNVHPAKREVRFQEPGKIRVALLNAIAPIVGTFSAPTSKPFFLQEIARPYTLPRKASSFETATLGLSEAPLVEEKGLEKKGSVPGSRDPGTDPFLKFRYVGAIAGGYWIFEEGDGFVLLLVRAALERITYDRLLRTLAQGILERQQLLIPEVVEVSPAEAAWVMAHRTFLEKAGLEVDLFGEGPHANKSLKIDTVPVLLKEVAPSELLHQLLGDLQKEKPEETLGQGNKSLEEALARSVSAMTAQRERLSEDATTAMMLVGDLLRCDLPYATPTGKPTMIQFSEAELQRKFRG
ncbi:MAG: DNA mismatch repair endonuclease MutL [Chthoniobacterales bacterium]|nr:DNA mismatch repair endonuclease MutL [Chthoniobacterales bacterium]